jgi:UDP-GlcNAc:undecaprenyl-phosphate GlcNAc-1-phosphate transferase
MALFLTPVMRHLALRLGVVSRPGRRHVNVRPVGRLGGLALFAALFSPLLLLLLVDSQVQSLVRPDLSRALGLLVGGAFMCAVGTVDDARGLPEVHKLFAQILTALFAYGVGFRIDGVSLPFVGEFSLGIFAVPVTVLWIVGVINAVNFTDGLDGLAAGVVLFAGVTNFVVASISGSALVALFMACLVGALLGFLFHNFNPARVFMGDCGSYLLGFVLSTTVIAGASSHRTSMSVAMLVPCVVLAVPIFDTLITLPRRYLDRRPLLAADWGHVHHRLLDKGLTHRSAVLVLYAVTIVLSASAIAIYVGRGWQIGLALLVSCAAFFGLVHFAGYFQYVRAILQRRSRAQGSAAKEPAAKEAA